MATTGTLSSGSDFIGLNDALKHTYEPTMQKLIVSDSELHDLFEEMEGFEMTDGPDGKQVNIAHLFSGGGGVSFMAEDGYIVTPATPDTKQSNITIKQVAASVELSGRTLRRVKEGPAAFASWADEALPLAVERLVHHKDRALMGKGDGIVCRINDASPATTDTAIDTAYGIAGFADPSALFMVGDQTRWSPNSTGASPRTGVAKITAVDFANKEIDIDAVPTSGADNDYVFIGDANVNGSGSVEAMGLIGHIDDGTDLGTYQGLSRTTYPGLKAQVLDSAAGGLASTLSEETVVEADLLARYRGNGKPGVLVASPKAAIGFWKAMKGDRQINDPRGAYKGGVDYKKGLSVMLPDRDLLVRPVRKCPNEVAFLLDAATLKMYRNGKGRWDDTDGSIWNRVVNSTGRKDAFFAVFIDEFETAGKAPLRNVRIKGLAA